MNPGGGNGGRFRLPGEDRTSRAPETVHRADTANDRAQFYDVFPITRREADVTAELTASKPTGRWVDSYPSANETKKRGKRI